MKQFILVLFICLTAISCKKNYISSEESKYYDEFYTVLNDLVRLRLTDVSAIYSETKPVYRTMWGNTSRYNIDSTIPPEPPPPGIIYYDTNTFNYFVRWKRLDSIDAKNMYQSIDSIKSFSIDTSRVILPVIDKEEFKQISKDNDLNERYKRLRSIYGTSCYIIVSTPIFNKDFTKILISIDYHCGPTWGQGYQFLLTKRNGKWWILEDTGTWES